MSLDFDAVRVFLRVVERGSFTAAARLLGTPLTSVSRRVKSLEESLGIHLLYRTTRKVWVTDAGRDFYERCLRAEGILDEAVQVAQAVRVEPEGVLRVLLPSTIGLSVVEPRLAEFRRRFPKVQLALTYNNQPLDLVEYGFDVALRIGPLPDSGYAARRLGWSRAKLGASPGYLAAHGRPLHPRELTAHQVIVMGGAMPLATLHFLDDSGGSAQVTVKPILTSNEAWTIIRQALNGEGIAVVSSQLAAEHFKTGKLEVVLDAWHRASDLELTAMYPARATSDRKVRAFVDFLSELFAEWTLASSPHP